MMSIKISVIIPTYRRSRQLINCLEALLAQNISKDEFEVIVVSDGPDLETEAAFSSWNRAAELQVKLVQTTRKKGPAAARNQGWLKAKAALIAFTDDDCVVEKTWLQSFLSNFKGEEFLAFTGKTIVPLPEKVTDFAFNLAQLETADFITANCASTKKALLQVGGFDERFKMAWREDSDLEFKLIMNNIPIVKVRQAIVVHPVRTVPWGISVKEQKKGVYDALLFKKYPELYRSKIPSSITRYYKMLGVMLILLLASWLKWPLVMRSSGLLLFILFTQFINKRLQNRHHSVNHIAEMVITSIAIPFLSIFWRIYGAIKYRILFL